MHEEDDLYKERGKVSPPQFSAAAWAWLTQPPSTAIKTEPVIAIVEELLEILTDRQRPDEERLAILRRAVRLLNAFVAGKEPTRR